MDTNCDDSIQGIMVVLGPGLAPKEGGKCLLGSAATLPSRDYLPTPGSLLDAFPTSSTAWLPMMVKGKAVQWLKPWVEGQETWTSPGSVTSSKTLDEPYSWSGIQCPCP